MHGRKSPCVSRNLGGGAPALALLTLSRDQGPRSKPDKIAAAKAIISGRGSCLLCKKYPDVTHLTSKPHMLGLKEHLMGNYFFKTAPSDGVPRFCRGLGFTGLRARVRGS